MKVMTTEQLEQHLEQILTSCRIAHEMWRSAMRQMKINSPEYRKVCAAGKAVFALKSALLLEYEDRVNSIQKTRDRFGEDCYWRPRFN